MAIIRLALGVAAALLFGGAAGGVHAASAGAPDATRLAAGRTLYLEGRRSGGQPLVARRPGGVAISGREAACVNCHRRSGFGGSEGRNYIPAVTSAALFHAPLSNTGATASASSRVAYTDQSLARTLREGIDPSGRRLDYLMPRYQLDDEDIAALVAHLGQLSSPATPYADGKPLDFATVVAPGVAPEKAQAMKEVLHACFAEHNAGPPPTPGRKRLGPDVQMGRPRPWKLHVWELTGTPETWAAQLAEQHRRTPPFALVGGIGGSDWQPVHHYCESAAVPCLFPHLEIPATGDPGFYALYLSRGLLLEAAILARHLGAPNPALKRVVQVLREDDPSARAAAEALRRDLAARGIASAARHVVAGERDNGILDTSAAEALVLWLRADDLKDLDAARPGAQAIYLSAILGGPEQAALPTAWKSRALMAYPYELPQNRGPRLTQLRAWLAARGLAAADEVVQGDAYIACRALGIGMNAVADQLHRDYLVDRLEVIVGRGGLAGHYPRLSLGAGQRFASKAGYLVRFADPESPRLLAVGERIAP